ncbi:7TM diverse intracellular signaling domain-containing protein [Echinicola jeungdonensis]|uniref:7TM diverse intracellular signaling domain-containing protein n=1 Tax=Echinicola jeungdonensis TaxID=709343 RepID=A0ABV5J8U5_9BACT|nr:7TM diverse intracellular signaling domain-containing protein [Echinicola jeungdonensis]MDN3670245.1 7TM diverse intracellular signaling domain-containing protein [Echinicola jeungdonensis]
MNPKFLKALILLVLTLPISVFGQRISGSSTLKIDDNLNERIFSISQLEFFEDKENTLEFKDVVAPDFQDNFKIRPSFSKNKFDIHNTYWVKLSIEKTPESNKKWLMEFYDQTIDSIEVFAPDGTGGYEKYKFGDAHSFQTRLFSHKNFELILNNNEEGIDNYYIKIRSNQKADIRIAIRSLNRFIYYALNEYFVYGIFYGMIAIIGLYNLLVYTAVREIKYLYYTFYLASVGIYAMCVDGIAFQYLWPNHPSWNQIANGIFSYSIVLWAILFSIRFLNIKHRSPKIHQFLLAILGIKSVLFLVGLIWDPKLFEIRYYDIIPFSFIFFASIYIWSRGYKVARFFVIAYGVLFFGVVIKVLVNTAIIPHMTLIYYSLHIAFLLEMLLLTFALGDRIRILKNNRDRAMKRAIKQIEINYALKEKVTQELELKVEERTRELKDKNQLLEKYNEQLMEKDEEIKRFNAILDKDNWKLKSSIKASFQARLTNKLLSYEEIQKIFPDQAACFRYLEEFKWGQGFVCRHCGNTKFSKGPKLFTKRCSKCGHIDSVTAGTVFHGIKFPIEKAFYIAYSTISNSEKQTLDQLSEQLDLRRNTVWTFKKKIQQLIQEKGLINPHWQDILWLEDNKVKTK